MKGVAPNGSMLASNILLMMELPAIEAASPARKPESQRIREVSLANVNTSLQDNVLLLYNEIFYSLLDHDMI